MKRIFAIGALLSVSLALAACDNTTDDDIAAANAAAPVQAPADHTLRDGLIGGALGYVAGRASAPRAPTYHVTHVTHVADPVYRAAPSYRPSYNVPRSRSVVTRTTVIRSYRR